MPNKQYRHDKSRDICTDHDNDIDKDYVHMDMVASESEEKRKKPTNQILVLSFLIKQSPCRTQCANQPSQKSDQSAALMHPRFDVSVLTIENKDNMKKNPCSLLFSVLLPFHDVNISKSSHVNLNQQAKKRSYQVKMRMREIIRQRKEKRSISKGVTAKGSKVRTDGPCSGRDPNEEREISPSMEKIKRRLSYTANVTCLWPSPSNSGIIQLKIGRGQLVRAHTNAIIQKRMRLRPICGVITKEDD